MTNKTFLLCSYSRSIIFFVLQIIHLFFKEYAIKELNIKNETTITLYYSSITLSAPALGSLIGGLLSNSLGGYESAKSSIGIILFTVIAGIGTFILSFTKNYYFFSFGMFIFFFSNSGILPTITGYTLLCVPNNIKSISSSIDQFITTLFGKFPGPIIFGVLNDYLGKINSDLAWQITMSYFYFGMFTLFLSCVFIKEKIKIIKKEEEEKYIGLAKSIRKNSKYISDVYSGDRLDLVRIGKHSFL